MPAMMAQNELTLDEAVSIALNKSTIVKKSLNNLKTFESSLKTAYGGLLPNLSASGSWNWQRSEDEGTTFNFGGAIFTTPPSVTESRTYSANINSNWTLFDGLANISNVSKSENNLQSAKLSLERLKQEIVFQTISLYYSVLNAKQLLKVQEDNVKQNQKNLETIMEKNRLGSVTLADVYAQQVQTGNAELLEIQARNSFETAKSNLLYYLGLDVFEEFTFPDSLTSYETNLLNEKLQLEFENLSELVEQALAERLDYKSALLSLESAYDDITIARGGHFPRLTGNMGFSSFANTFNKLFESKSYSVGLTLSIPVFSGWAIDNSVQFAVVNAENKELEVNDLERTIRQNIKQTFLDLEAAEKQLNVSGKNVAAALENLKIEQEKYSLGAGKLLDVLIANTNYTEALTNQINSQFSFITLSEQLKYYIGVLDYKKFE